MTARFGSSQALRRYFLLQLPEAALVVAVLLGLLEWEIISSMTAGAIALVWIAKDVALYPIVRPAYETSPPHGTEAMIGLTATVVVPPSPEGTVRVGAELWSARLADATAPHPEAGARVRVCAVEGLTLIVAEAALEPMSAASLPSR